MRVYLIRHGATKGNIEHRYVGSTDEELDLKGRIRLKEMSDKWKSEVSSGGFREKFLNVDRLLVSPLKRCRQTAEILYPGKKQIIVEALKECSFGEFEYKNYQELNGRDDYQKFIDTKGECGFPGGETLAAFKDRCVRGFKQAVDQAICQRDASVAFVIHGGTIMAILDEFSFPHKDYYEWQTGNGEGFGASVLRDEERFYLGEIKRLWQ